jgi:hypothetical protein
MILGAIRAHKPQQPQQQYSIAVSTVAVAAALMQAFTAQQGLLSTF